MEETFAVIYPEEKVDLKEFKDIHYANCIKDHEAHIEEDCAPVHPVEVIVKSSSIGGWLIAVCTLCGERLNLCCDERVDNI